MNLCIHLQKTISTVFLQLCVAQCNCKMKKHWYYSHFSCWLPAQLTQLGDKAPLYFPSKPWNSIWLTSLPAERRSRRPHTDALIHRQPRPLTNAHRGSASSGPRSRRMRQELQLQLGGSSDGETPLTLLLAADESAAGDVIRGGSTEPQYFALFLREAPRSSPNQNDFFFVSQ